jgi:hypothetical protein
MRKRRTYTLVEAGSVFIITLIVIVLTTLGVYFWGLGHHRTFFENSMMSTTALALSFFSFTTIGLYRGVKLRDNLGRVTDRYKSKFLNPNTSDRPVTADPGIDISDAPALGDDLLSIIASIIFWILVAFVLSFALSFVGDMLVVSVLAFVAMLYWIFFRALRLVFKNSNRSKGDLLESMKWGLFYTFLYSSWIYGIFFVVELLKR